MTLKKKKKLLLLRHMKLHAQPQVAKERPSGEDENPAHRAVRTLIRLHKPTGGAKVWPRWRVSNWCSSWGNVIRAEKAGLAGVRGVRLKVTQPRWAIKAVCYLHSFLPPHLQHSHRLLLLPEQWGCLLVIRGSRVAGWGVACVNTVREPQPWRISEADKWKTPDWVSVSAAPLF